MINGRQDINTVARAYGLCHDTYTHSFLYGFLSRHGLITYQLGTYTNECRVLVSLAVYETDSNPSRV